MRLTRRHRAILLFGALLGAAACNPNFSPSNVAATAALAIHFDSLATNALESDTIPQLSRAEILATLEMAAAFGAAPVQVTVTTASSIQEWQALAVLEIDTVTYDTTAMLVAYSDSLVTSAVAVTTRHLITGDSITTVTGLFADSLLAGLTSITSSLAPAADSGTCATPPTGLTDTLFVNLQFAHNALNQVECTIGTALSSFTATFALPPGINSAFTTVTLPSTAVPAPMVRGAFAMGPPR